ncbi:type II toxin-antitoxin system prevent-host-death family antitoxin [Paracoccus aestuariivivens]|uniref:type II toxin-antitoxin system Phd/YefM family antitoxin n=1 Tax=Paracoccus aestuariivivens TaxID=1820333 RepID=UPI0031B56890
MTDAKKRLDELIDLAIAGEEIIITRWGKPVGKLRAFRQVQTLQNASEEFLAELERSVRDYDR